MSEATRKTTPTVGRPPFELELIDLETHPDGPLLSLCGSLMRMRAATMAIEDAIAAMPATTMLGLRMLECVR